MTDGECKHYDKELDCCKLLSDWGQAMPVLQPCVKSPCGHFQSEEKGADMKEKQIEEMARDICTNRNASITHECKECALSAICLYKETANVLYRAGYRKQTECEDVSRFRGVFECSACHWTDEDIGTADPIQFCAGCGAKVKGGDE